MITYTATQGIKLCRYDVTPLRAVRKAFLSRDSGDRGSSGFTRTDVVGSTSFPRHVTGSLVFMDLTTGCSLDV